jgi:hypothetical protein
MTRRARFRQLIGKYQWNLKQKQINKYNHHHCCISTD